MSYGVLILVLSIFSNVFQIIFVDQLVKYYNSIFNDVFLQ